MNRYQIVHFVFICLPLCTQPLIVGQVREGGAGEVGTVVW